MAILAFRAGEAIQAGDAVYVDSSPFVYKGLGDTQEKSSVIGIAEDRGNIGDLIRINTDNICYKLTGFDVNEYLFLSFIQPGLVVDYATWESDLSSAAFNPYLTRVGRALSSTAVEVEINKPVSFVNPFV